MIAHNGLKHPARKQQLPWDVKSRYKFLSNCCKLILVDATIIPQFCEIISKVQTNKDVNLSNYQPDSVTELRDILLQTQS